jgi:signal transduction histidine kinase
LYFREEQIGFAVFDAEATNGVVYDTLRASLSSALQAERLVRGLDLRTRELLAAYTNLEANQQKLIISEKVASLGRLTAGIAHEMNTPLAAIRAAAKELRQLIDEYQRSIDHPDVRAEDHHAIASDMLKNLAIADTAAEKSAGFIRGIKAQTINVKEKRQQAFSAAPVIRDTLALLEFALRKGHCTLTSELDDAICLFGDPRGLSQILTNLITNGVEACAPAGGAIAVVFDREVDRARLRVTDSGAGIPPEVLARIFEPLFTTKPFGQGTGLGLAIVHDLVKEFNATMRVDSRPGATTFLISFPVDRRNA